MRRSAWTGAVAVAAALSLGITACGGGDDNGGGGGNSESSAKQGAPVQGKQGGKLTVLWTDDVDFIDCGETYYQMGYFICSATQKALYSYKPDDGTQMVPDLAESLPEVSDDGKTVTVKIKAGVKFSPPVDREVTSKDVKYAIERGFFNTVNNGYAGAYFGDLVGAKVGAKPGTTIRGLETPDDQTLVMKLSKPTGGVLAAGALGMNLTAPVPEDYASKMDAKNPSTYGTSQVATGPYMIANDSSGKATGYVAGRRIHLVRNPNWDKSKDFRPAYLDEIDNLEGNDDTTVAARRVLTGQSLLTGDFSPPPAILRQASRTAKEQLYLGPGGGGRWVSMNTKIKPFDDVNVRKAVVAGFDRNAMRLTRGGPIVGSIPTHYLPPGLAGYDQAGGAKGPGLDFMNTTGEPNPQLSAEYFKKAGYASGKYEGNEELLMVGTSGGVAEQAAEVARQNFQNMGFKVRLRLVTQDSMYTKFCNVPSQKVAICPNVGWLKDFSDGQTLLDPTFNGENILPQGNSNWSQLDDKTINEQMDKAKLLTDPDERAAAWAQADKEISAQAPAVPWLWDTTPTLASKNVQNVISLYNGSQSDISWISLK
jgi:peptide/nickel transport system substrate-binding protein